jgi:hypothetical protein
MEKIYRILVIILLVIIAVVTVFPIDHGSNNFQRQDSHHVTIVLDSGTAISIPAGHTIILESPSGSWDRHPRMAWGGQCNTFDKVVDDVVYCFRGNIELSYIPGIIRASAHTGISYILGPATHNLTDCVAVYIEDVGDLGYFWDEVEIFE